MHFTRARKPLYKLFIYTREILSLMTQEGKEFLKNQGMAVTDDAVKTRGQKELLEEITTSNNGESKEEETDAAKPRIPRDGTMAVTAKVFAL